MAPIDRRIFCSRCVAGLAFLGSGVSAVSGCTSTDVGNEESGYPKIIGTRKTYTTRYRDSLIALARGFRLGYLELAAANPGVDPWVPGADVEIVLPTSHIVPEGATKGLLINLAEQRLYFFRGDGRTIYTAPVGIGAEGWATPTGHTKVVRKKENPTWYVPRSIRKEQPDLPAAVPPGPDNPLGAHALYFGWPSYLLHGTNKPDGVGRLVSHGCVRLYPEDAARLYDDVAIGTPVTIVDQELKIASVGDALWIQVHLSRRQALEFERRGKFTAEEPSGFENRISRSAGDKAARIDWRVVRKAVRERRGVPVRVVEPRGVFGILTTELPRA